MIDPESTMVLYVYKTMRSADEAMKRFIKDRGHMVTSIDRNQHLVKTVTGYSYYFVSEHQYDRFTVGKRFKEITRYSF